MANDNASGTFTLRCIQGLYLALVGKAIDAMGRDAYHEIAPDLAANRIERDGKHLHCTLCHRKELSPFLEGIPSKKRRQKMVELVTKIHDEFGQVESWPVPLDLGLGKAQGPDHAVAYYRVLHWPLGQRIRQFLGLPPCTFHVTLGFSPADVHVPKGPATLVPLYNQQLTLPDMRDRLVLLSSIVDHYQDDLCFIRLMILQAIYTRIPLLVIYYYHLYNRNKQRQRKKDRSSSPSELADLVKKMSIS